MIDTSLLQQHNQDHFMGAVTESLNIIILYLLVAVF